MLSCAIGGRESRREAALLSQREHYTLLWEREDTVERSTLATLQDLIVCILGGEFSVN